MLNTVFPGSCFCFTTGQGAENFITCVLMGLKDHAPKRFFSRPSFCRSLLGTASPLQRRKHLLEPLWKCSTNLPNHRSHSCASSDSLLFPQKCFSWFLLLKLCRLLIGLFRGAAGNFAGLFGVFYYIFLVKAPVKLPKLKICAR